MACPYFWPISRHESELWNHRKRLPLGDGYAGECRAPGCEGRVPEDDELRGACNLGYARSCPHLPKERHADAIHFSATGTTIVKINFVAVKNHGPAEHGALQFDSTSRVWITAHADPGIQNMAERYLDAWLAKRGRV